VDELCGLDRKEVNAIGRTGRPRTVLESGFSVPVRDLGEVLETIGCKLFTRERTLGQYLAWSVQTGLFDLLSRHPEVSISEASAATPLTECGADSLLGVLCALGLVGRSATGRYRIADASRDYFVSGSPYFVGDQLPSSGFPIPGPYLRDKIGFLSRARLWWLGLKPAIRYGSTLRLENQHARNLGACVSAVRTGEFSDVCRIVDIAGGSGAFAIPLAVDYPEKQVILADLPYAVRNVRPLLRAHNLGERVRLRELDAFRLPWNIPDCDGIFIGNFLHGFDDESCALVCREGFRRLSPGGRLWIHEMLWRDSMDGPLMTALWHAAMRSAGPGRQRTELEFRNILRSSGFVDLRAVPTSGAYVLVSGRKPD